MRDFLVESELTERRAFIESFVKEIVVTPDDALMRYTVRSFRWGRPPVGSGEPGAAVPGLPVRDLPRRGRP